MKLSILKHSEIENVVDNYEIEILIFYIPWMVQLGP
jgi:hypothetical protein